MKLKCPRCGREHSGLAVAPGASVVCVGCRQTFATTAAGATALTSRVPPPPPAPSLLRTIAGSSSAASPNDTTTLANFNDQDPLPRRLGRFELRSRLGVGAYGSVYRAFDQNLRREIALKLPHPVALLMTGVEARFQREAAASAQLRHPHIVEVYEAGRIDGQLYIASALIPGGSLQEAVDARTFEPRAAAEVICKLADALQHAHDKGIIHRDVKPSNVLLDEHGEPYLADFGLALWNQASQQLTMGDKMMGTPAFMSPEQALGKNDAVGPAADQYALGVMLYRMLCGGLPFEGPPLAVIVQIRTDTPMPVMTRNPNVPPALAAVCERAMRKEAADRFPSCGEMAQALRDYLSGKAPPVSAKPGARHLMRNRAAAAVAIVGLILAAGLTLVLNRPRPETPPPESPPDIAHTAPDALSDTSVDTAHPRSVPMMAASVVPEDPLPVASPTAATSSGASLPPAVPTASSSVPAPMPTTSSVVASITPSFPATPVPSATPNSTPTSSPSAMPPLAAATSAGATTPPPFPANPAREPAPLSRHFNSVNMPFVYIDPSRLTPGGKFTMGRLPIEATLFPPNNLYREPAATQHTVTLTKRFLVGATEVTQSQWQAVLGTSPWLSDNAVPVGDDYPAVSVTKADCITFCLALSRKEGLSYRLITEAEWEYCCRAGTTSVFYYGDNPAQLDEYAWAQFNANTGRQLILRPVAQKKPNAWGLFDMYGNAWERVADGVQDHSPNPQVDPLIIVAGTSSIVRGGSFYCYLRNEFSSGARATDSDSRAAQDLGFRVVCEMDAKLVAVLSRANTASDAASTAPAAAAEEPNRFPIEPIKIGGHRYQLIMTAKSWPDAKAHCETLGGQLACLESKAENDAVGQFVKSAVPELRKLSPGDTSFWVFFGATDGTSAKEFRWVNDQPLTFANWNHGEPKNAGGGQARYVAAIVSQNTTELRWSAIGGSRQAYLCEWDR